MKDIPGSSGSCWCGCGATVPTGSYFERGHDKRAESMMTKLRFGTVDSVARRMADSGFGVGEGLRNLTREYAGFEGDVEKARRRRMELIGWARRRGG